MSITSESTVQELEDRREAVLRDPSFIADQEFKRRTMEAYKQSDRYKACLKRDRTGRERIWRDLEEAGRLKDPVDAYMESVAYKAEEEWKQRHMEMYKLTDRYKAYEKRKLAELEEMK